MSGPHDSAGGTPAITGFRYVLFTSFRRTGEAVATPVWIAPLNSGQACFTIAADSGKAKRLGHTSRVTVQGCDVRGRLLPGTEPITGSATLVHGPDCQPVNQAVKAKYGLQFQLMNLASDFSARIKRRPNPDTGVIISF